METRSLLACMLVAPQDLPPERRALWDEVIEAIVAEGHPAPRIHPGSVFVPCQGCNERVAVGPRQQRLMNLAKVLCYLCAGQAAGKAATATILGPDLADHILSKQVYPQLLARDLNEEGVGIKVAWVSNQATAEGYEITCEGCGRVAKAQTKPPANLVAICPDCARRAREGD